MVLECFDTVRVLQWYPSPLPPSLPPSLPFSLPPSLLSPLPLSQQSSFNRRNRTIYDRGSHVSSALYGHSLRVFGNIKVVPHHISPLVQVHIPSSLHFPPHPSTHPPSFLTPPFPPSLSFYSTSTQVSNCFTPPFPHPPLPHPSTHSPLCSLTHPSIPSPHSLTPPSLTPLLPHSPLHSLTHPSTPSLTPPLPHSPLCSLTHSSAPSLTPLLPHSPLHSLTSPSLSHPLPHSPLHSPLTPLLKEQGCQSSIVVIQHDIVIVTSEWLSHFSPLRVLSWSSEIPVVEVVVQRRLEVSGIVSRGAPQDCIPTLASNDYLLMTAPSLSSSSPLLCSPLPPPPPPLPLHSSPPPLLSPSLSIPLLPPPNPTPSLLLLLPPSFPLLPSSFPSPGDYTVGQIKDTLWSCLRSVQLTNV